MVLTGGLHTSSLGVLVASGFILYLTARAIYHVYFHPLAHIPGPWLWRATRLRYIVSLTTGNLVADVLRIHAQYGDVVRLAPDEVSFATEDAWQDIFAAKAGHKHMYKNPIFFKAPPPQPENMVTVRDLRENQRMRTLMAPAFTETALVEQEPIVRGYVDLLVAKLRDCARAGGDQGAVVNMVNWFNWALFDIISDLCLGESFGSLRDGAYHWWVATIFQFLKGMTLAAAARFYPAVDSLLMKLVPAKIRKLQADHYNIAVERIAHRMNLDKQRKDFMSPVISNNPDYSRMSLDEIESTFSMLIIAGSETTATTLTGITNFLAGLPEIRARLIQELRTHFQHDSEMTFATTKNLPYLDAVISEGLRLCNPVPAGLPRVVPDGGDHVSGYFLPGRTMVSVTPTVLARSPKHFHRPDEFCPERWLPGELCPEEFVNDHRSNQKPFGIGPRACFGRLLAWAEMRLILARLIWNLDFLPPPGGLVDWFGLKTYMVVEKSVINVRIKERKELSIS